MTTPTERHRKSGFRGVCRHPISKNVRKSNWTSCSVPPKNIPYGKTWCLTFPQPKNIDLKPPIGQLSLRGCYTILFSDQFYGLPVASERSSAGPRSLLGPLGARRQSTWSFCTIQKKKGEGGKEPCQISERLADQSAHSPNAK